MALGAGASFVARTTVFDFRELREFIAKALAHRGFSLVEVLTPCPTYFGWMNDLREPYEMLHHLKDTTIPPDEKSVEAEVAPQGKKLPLGIFQEEHRAEYTELYRQLCEAAKAGDRTK